MAFGLLTVTPRRESHVSTQLLEAPETRVHEAIGRCLEACHGSGNPLAVLAEYIASLQAEGWEESETQRVEVAVLKMLVALLSPDDDEDGSDIPGYW